MLESLIMSISYNYDKEKVEEFMSITTSMQSVL